MVGIFREGEHIPLHDHPDMHGIIKCLAGSLKITSYTKLPVTSLPTNLPDKMKESSKIQEKLRCGMLRINADGLSNYCHLNVKATYFLRRRWIQR